MRFNATIYLISSLERINPSQCNITLFKNSYAYSSTTTHANFLFLLIFPFLFLKTLPLKVELFFCSIFLIFTSSFNFLWDLHSHSYHLNLLSLQFIDILKKNI